MEYVINILKSRNKIEITKESCLFMVHKSRK